MRSNSKEIFSKACDLIPGGVNSPVRAFKSVGMPFPMIVQSGRGAVIRDVDSNEYIDYCMGWGSLILGHTDPKIVEAATRQMAMGSSFGITTELEIKMAEILTKLIPSVEKSRLVSTGTEAAMTAVRLARGFTEKKKVIQFANHYHGHSDALLLKSKGVMNQDTICLGFNDFAGVQNFFRNDPRAKEVACVILEPVAANAGVILPERGFLEMLREETRRAGALLIFDEVITGFRVGLHGAQGFYRIDPDLSCFGKIMGGGFPIAAVGGKKEILDALAPIGEVYQAGTLSGNPVAVAAGLAALEEIEKKGFYEELERKTNLLTEPIRKALEGTNIRLIQSGSMFSIHCERALFNELFMFLFKEGIYIPPSSMEAWFLSAAHTQAQIQFTADKILQFLSLVL